MDPIELLTNLENAARAEAAAGHIVTSSNFYTALADFAAWMKAHALEEAFPDEETTKPGGDEPSATTPA